MDLRNSPADCRVRGCSSWPAGRSARRSRVIPEHAVDEHSRIGNRQHRSGGCDPAADVCRRCHSRPGLERVRDESVGNSNALCRRISGNALRQCHAQRDALCKGLRRTQKRKVESPVERADSGEQVFGDCRGHVLAQPESAGIVRSQLQATDALYAYRRSGQAGVRAADEHRAGHRSKRLAGCAGRVAVLPCGRASLRPRVAESSAQLPVFALDIQLVSHMESVVRLLQRP